MHKISKFFKKKGKKTKQETVTLFKVDQEDVFDRFQFLLDHAPNILHAYDNTDIRYYHQRDIYNDGTEWEKFRNKIEQKYGYIFNDSCSSLATVDNNPGPGRFLDKKFLQPSGKWLTSILLNWELRSFHPPKEEAHKIFTFLRSSKFLGNYFRPPGEPSIPTKEIAQFLHHPDISKSCFQLFDDFRGSEEVVKAFKRLLLQAR